MGKRPDWLRAALAAGKSMEEFLIAATAPATTGTAKAPKRKVSAAASPKATARKAPTARKTRKPAEAPAAS
jgi:ribosomal protein L12E/L44/L45/RPP1/RPP2